MEGRFRSVAASVHRYSVVLVGSLLIGVSAIYAVVRGGPAPTLLLELLVPLGVGLTLCWDGARRSATSDDTERTTVVATAALAAGAVGATVALWAMALTELRMDASGDFAQLGLFAASVGVAVGAVLGHTYASLTDQHRETVRLSQALDNSMDGVAILEDGEHVYANDAYADLYGVPNPDILEGESWQSLYTNTAAATIQREVFPPLEERSYWRGRFTGSRLDGTTFPKEVTASVAEEGYVIVVRDISGQQEREQRIQVLNRVLRHNLRNTFTVIQGHANLVAERAAELEEAHVEPIRREIADLLATADKARGVERTLDRTGEHGPIDPSEAVRTTVDRATAAYPDATVHSRVEESGLAPVDASITDALNELVDNAVEHADQQSPTVEVSVRSVEFDGTQRVEFGVADDGPGIPEADREAVLQGEETPLAHGSGLGLWLVNWIVSNADGDLSFTDAPGGGTEVTITFVEDGSVPDEGIGEPVLA